MGRTSEGIIMTPDQITTLRQHIANGIVREQTHPTLPLSIYNYTQRCQYDRLWDDVALQCRGLVMHGDRVVARPFRKFFNDTEHAPEEIPWHLPHEVYEKLDGSLLIWFNFEGQWHSATRGSFTSTQSVVGESIIYSRHADYPFDPAVTYLFEVIYPANRVVVNYGDRCDVTLLGMIHTESGEELPLPETGSLPAVRRLPSIADPAQVRHLIRDDEEGYVIRFANGFRIKVKGDRYIELHRAMAGISSRMVWEYLSEGKPFQGLLEVVPDEFCAWVDAERRRQRQQFYQIAKDAKSAIDAASRMPDRKSQAWVILNEHKPVSSIAFAMLDDKPADKLIWKMIYPEYCRPEFASGELLSE
jgi:RNA ligase